jgi:hypothetical protein
MSEEDSRIVLDLHVPISVAGNHCGEDRYLAGKSCLAGDHVWPEVIVSRVFSKHFCLAGGYWGQGRFDCYIYVSRSRYGIARRAPGSSL